MNQIMMSAKKSAPIKKLLISALVIAFFVGIVLAYYNMLYNQTRDSIIKNGQSAAIQSKNYLNDYALDKDNWSGSIITNILDEKKKTITNYNCLF